MKVAMSTIGLLGKDARNHAPENSGLPSRFYRCIVTEAVSLAKRVSGRVASWRSWQRPGEES
jgi:hypothetical protein